MLAYLSELTDLRFELEAIEQQLDRFEYALLALEQAVQTNRGGVPDADAAAGVQVHEHVSRFEAAMRKAGALLERLVSVADQIDAALDRTSSSFIGELSLPEARSTIGEVTTGMERLIDTWKKIRDRIGFDLLRVATEGGVDQPRWAEHWPYDADLANELVTGDLALKERDRLMLTFYYERGLTQSHIAESLGVSQATIAGRMAILETIISAEIALRRFGQRFPLNEQMTRSLQVRRDLAVRVAVIAEHDAHKRILLVGSDRFERRVSLAAELKKAPRVDDVAVYDIESGQFRFRTTPVDAEGLIAEHPYRSPHDFYAAFPVTEQEWRR